MALVTYNLFRKVGEMTMIFEDIAKLKNDLIIQTDNLAINLEDKSHESGLWVTHVDNSAMQH